MSLLGGVVGLFSGFSAARSAKNIGRLNVKNITVETQEEQRRFRRETENVLDTARARMGASGFSSESASFKTFLGAQQAEANKQLSFMRKSAQTRKDLAKAGADSAASQAKWGGITSFIGGVESAAMSAFGGGG